MTLALESLATSVTRPAAPRGWWWAPDAALKMGVDVGHLRRLCRDKYAAMGLARKENGEWQISTAADTRLSYFETWQTRDHRQLGELRKEGYSKAAVERAEAIKTIVLESWEYKAQAHGKEAQLREFVTHLLAAGRLPNRHIKKLKPGTLYKWGLAYSRDGLRGLIRKQYPSRGQTSFGPKARDLFLVFKHAGSHVPVTEAYRQTESQIAADKLKDDPEWALPSLRQVQDWYQNDVPLPVKIHVEEGPHRYRAKCHPKITRSLEEVPAGSHFVLDERLMDFMVRVPGDGTFRRARPKLTATMDVRSRFIGGWVLGEFANSDTILSSFKMCCETLETVADDVTMDHGIDYRSVAGRSRRSRKWDEFDPARVQGCFERLEIRTHFALVKWPWSKSVESRFRTVKDRFDRWMAGFWGGNPGERPWDADHWTRESIERLPTMEEAADMFAEFLAALHEEPIAGDGAFNLCPRQILRHFFTPNPREVSEDTLLFACTRMLGPVTVRRDGVRHNKIIYGKFDEKLWRLMGKQVYFLADPARADHITICDQDGVPICTAWADNNLGQTTEEVRAAQSMKRRADRILKEYPAARDISLMTTPQQIAERRMIAAKARQIPDDELPPPAERESVRIVRPDVAVAAAEIKRAAGAEALRRLSGVDAAAEAVNRPRPITFADLAGANAGNEEETESPERRMTLTDFLKTEAATHVTD